RKAHPLFERSAEVVAAPVRDRREEGMHEVAVGAVNLEDFESGRERALRRAAKGVDQALDLRGREFARRRVALAFGNRARPDSLPGRFRTARLLQRRRPVPRTRRAPASTGMADLDAGHRAIGPIELGDLPQSGYLAVVPYARAAVG